MAQTGRVSSHGRTELCLIGYCRTISNERPKLTLAAIGRRRSIINQRDSAMNDGRQPLLAPISMAPCRYDCLFGY